jgi:hypothetical protein
MRALSVLALLGLAVCALPPGYEEELYCPSYMCLKRKEQPPGWTGPRAAFHECCEEGSGKIAPPHAWGVKVGEEVKDQLLRDGWHSAKCAQQKGMCGTQRRVVHGLMGLLRRMEGVLTMN